MSRPSSSSAASAARPSMSFGLAAFKFKMQTYISGLESRKKRRQEEFGMEYMKLLVAHKQQQQHRGKAAISNNINANKSENKRQAKVCLEKAMHDMEELNQEIEHAIADMEGRERGEMDDKIQHRQQQKQEQEQAKNSKSKSRKKGKGKEDEGSKDDADTANNISASHRSEAPSASSRSDGVMSASNQSSNDGGPGGGRGRGRGGRGRGRGRGRGGSDRGGRGRGRGGRGRGRGQQIPPMSPGARPLNPDQRLPKRVEQREAFQPRHSPEGKRARLSPVKMALAPKAFQPGSNLVEKWTHSEWKFQEYKTNGGWSKTTEGIVEKFPQKSITRGIQKFKTHPQLFIAMMYPTLMLKWPEHEQEYTLIYRDGTTGLKPKGVSAKGQVTFLMHQYQPLPSLPNDELPKNNRDDYTDKMTYRKQKLVTKKLPAYLPGRGTGLLDDPRIKIIGDIDPSDIAQGQVGDCWLLSGIASLAEFNGAIHRLFRKTKDLDQMPFADGRPNMYTVTLWDLTTWEEVDIVVDERLPARKDIQGALFGAKATQDGELWCSYLEKAIAAHCGGWDKIDGGQCTHAWSLLTGCKDQYIIQRIPENTEKGPFGMWAKYNPETDEWAPQENSPSDGHQGVWRVPWPELGGGGVDDLQEDDLFLRLCAWSDQNYLIGASSKGDSDRNSTNGVVDNHAYSVIDCRHDVAGTGFDMIQVRNPWGYGGIENGQFARKGKGWKQYPEIQKALKYKELEEDDGVFWVTKQEFFKHYHAIYVGAMNMKTFLGIAEDDEEDMGNANRVFVPSSTTGGLPNAPLFEAESDAEGHDDEEPRGEKDEAPAGSPIPAANIEQGNSGGRDSGHESDHGDHEDDSKESEDLLSDEFVRQKIATYSDEEQDESDDDKSASSSSEEEEETSKKDEDSANDDVGEDSENERSDDEPGGTSVGAESQKEASDDDDDDDDQPTTSLVEDSEGKDDDEEDGSDVGVDSEEERSDKGKDDDEDDSEDDKNDDEEDDDDDDSEDEENDEDEDEDDEGESVSEEERSRDASNESEEEEEEDD
jgi:hypothetical protein